jgi:2-oxo-3-hexenedioate decarboxylase
MNLKAIAKTLDRAAVRAEPIAQIGIDLGLNVNKAYKIQEYLIEERLKRGEIITGYKLGFTSKAKMKQMNVDDLIWGVLTNSMEIKPNENIDLDQYIHPRAEPEVAFRIGRDIDGQITLNEVPKYVDKMAVAIEVIDSRYKNFKFSLEDVIADNCSSTGYCAGEWQDLKHDLSNLEIKLKYDDTIVQEGLTKAILENPFQSVVELSRLVSKKGSVLKKGHIILAGAATSAEWLKPKTKVSAELSNFGRISFKTK